MLNAVQGIVREVNRKSGIVVLEVASGDYTVIEVPHCDLEAGDLLYGDFSSIGSKIMRNETKEELLHVYIQEIHVSLDRAKELLL